jgi:hypothetical protein
MRDRPAGQSSNRRQSDSPFHRAHSGLPETRKVGFALQPKGSCLPVSSRFGRPVFERVWPSPFTRLFKDGFDRFSKPFYPLGLAQIENPNTPSLLLVRRLCARLRSPAPVCARGRKASRKVLTARRRCGPGQRIKEFHPVLKNSLNPFTRRTCGSVP